MLSSVELVKTTPLRKKKKKELRKCSFPLLPDKIIMLLIQLDINLLTRDQVSVALIKTDWQPGCENKTK